MCQEGPRAWSWAPVALDSPANLYGSLWERVGLQGHHLCKWGGVRGTQANILGFFFCLSESFYQ